MTIGVYIIKNTKNEKIYIGSSKHCEVRFLQHKNALKNNRHHCTHLQTSWIKHGEENFSFEVIRVFESIDLALKAEDELLLQNYGTKNCFNSSPYAKLPFLHKHVRQKAEISISKSDYYKKVHSDVCKKRNSDPEFLERLRAAIRGSDKHRNAVRENAKNLQNPAVVAKNRAALKNSTAQKDAARRHVREVLMSPEIRAKNLAATSVPVIGVHAKTGEVIRFSSQSDAARFLGCHSAAISECCKGKTKTVKGYSWKKEAH